jgi:ATP-dependent helicase/DNAse subunit B
MESISEVTKSAHMDSSKLSKAHDIMTIYPKNMVNLQKAANDSNEKISLLYEISGQHYIDTLDAENCQCKDKKVHLSELDLSG